MVMARDGLLPDWFARVHPRLGTPANATAFTGVTTGLLAGSYTRPLFGST
jgi:APA family basic amino acid/polyamine antiporter